MEMKRKQPHEMVESKEAKLQVETASEFDANENADPQPHLVQQPQAQQPSSAVKSDQNAAPITAVQHHDHDSEPKISHAQVHEISHGEPVIKHKPQKQKPITMDTCVYIKDLTSKYIDWKGSKIERLIVTRIQFWILSVAMNGLVLREC